MPAALSHCCLFFRIAVRGRCAYPGRTLQCQRPPRYYCCQPPPPPPLSPRPSQPSLTPPSRGELSDVTAQSSKQYVSYVTVPPFVSGRLFSRSPAGGISGPANARQCCQGGGEEVSWRMGYFGRKKRRRKGKGVGGGKYIREEEKE